MDFAGSTLSQQYTRQRHSTAVTRSVVDPRTDFQSNALGTVNVLKGSRPLLVLYSFDEQG